MHALEYLDFPDEKIRWTKLYQKPVGGSRSKEMKRQIMVGDLVDWWTDNCYWTGRLTEIVGDGKARIELLPPPVGEGLSYEVFLKDLRPTLEWSLDNGWTVPTSEKESSYCARIIKPLNPVNQEGSQILMVPPVEMTENAQPTAGPSPEWAASGTMARYGAKFERIISSCWSKGVQSALCS
ncbi:hypothetical protein AB3S75_044557 [Citrus x aurantiifolia]